MGDSIEQQIQQLEQRLETKFEARLKDAASLAAAVFHDEHASKLEQRSRRAADHLQEREASLSEVAATRREFKLFCTEQMVALRQEVEACCGEQRVTLENQSAMRAQISSLRQEVQAVESAKALEDARSEWVKERSDLMRTVADEQKERSCLDDAVKRLSLEFSAERDERSRESMRPTVLELRRQVDSFEQELRSLSQLALARDSATVDDLRQTVRELCCQVERLEQVAASGLRTTASPTGAEEAAMEEGAAEQFGMAIAKLEASVGRVSRDMSQETERRSRSLAELRASLEVRLEEALRTECETRSRSLSEFQSRLETSFRERAERAQTHVAEAVRELGEILEPRLERRVDELVAGKAEPETGLSRRLREKATRPSRIEHQRLLVDHIRLAVQDMGVMPRQSRASVRRASVQGSGVRAASLDSADVPEALHEIDLELFRKRIALFKPHVEEALR